MQGDEQKSAPGFIGFKVRDTKDPVSEFLNLEDVSDRQVDVQNHLSPEKPAITDPLAEATEVCRNAKRSSLFPGTEWHLPRLSLMW